MFHTRKVILTLNYQLCPILYRFELLDSMTGDAGIAEDAYLVDEVSRFLKFSIFLIFFYYN